MRLPRCRRGVIAGGLLSPARPNPYLHRALYVRIRATLVVFAPGHCGPKLRPLAGNLRFCCGFQTTMRFGICQTFAPVGWSICALRPIKARVARPHRWSCRTDSLCSCRAGRTRQTLRHPLVSVKHLSRLVCGPWSTGLRAPLRASGPTAGPVPPTDRRQGPTGPSRPR